MSISRRDLYAAGEPFGESCTRQEAGRTIYGGGGSSSSSAQTTNNQDNRTAVQDGIGLSASNNNAIGITTNNTTTVNTLDAGAIKSAFDFSGDTVERALDTVDMSNATLGDGFDALLSAAERLFDKGDGLIGQTQKAVADAYAQAKTDTAGTIDNRTIIVLAVAGAAAVYAMSRRK